MAERTFQVVLVKPSHYDDDGYVIQWRRSTILSNSLASVYALIADCGERRVLGDDVEIAIDAFDEANTVIRVGQLAQRIREAGAGSSAWSGCSRTSTRAPSTWRGSSAPPGCRW